MESFLENVKDLKLFMVNIAFIVSSILYGIQYLEEIKEDIDRNYKDNMYTQMLLIGHIDDFYGESNISLMSNEKWLEYGFMSYKLHMLKIEFGKIPPIAKWEEPTREPTR